MIVIYCSLKNINFRTISWEKQIVNDNYIRIINKIIIIMVERKKNVILQKEREAIEGSTKQQTITTKKKKICYEFYMFSISLLIIIFLLLLLLFVLSCPFWIRQFLFIIFDFISVNNTIEIYYNSFSFIYLSFNPWHFSHVSLPSVIRSIGLNQRENVIVIFCLYFLGIFFILIYFIVYI